MSKCIRIKTDIKYIHPELGKCFSKFLAVYHTDHFHLVGTTIKGDETIRRKIREFYKVHGNGGFSMKKTRDEEKALRYLFHDYDAENIIGIKRYTQDEIDIFIQEAYSKEEKQDELKPRERALKAIEEHIMSLQICSDPKICMITRSAYNYFYQETRARRMSWPRRDFIWSIITEIFIRTASEQEVMKWRTRQEEQYLAETHGIMR